MADGGRGLGPAGHPGTNKYSKLPLRALLRMSWHLYFFHVTLDEQDTLKCSAFQLVNPKKNRMYVL